MAQIGRRAVLVGTGALALCWLSPLRAADNVPGLRILLQELPPFVYNRRGVPEGFVPELMAALLAEQGVQGHLEFAPLPRAVELLRANPMLIYAPIAKVPGNANEFKWIRPLLRNRVFAYRRASDAPLPGSLDALKAAQRIAVGAGGGHQALAQDAGFHNLVPVRGQVDAVRRLMTGDVDFCIASDLAMQGILDSEKLKPSAVQATEFVLSETEVHIAFSPQASAEFLAGWHAALEQLRRSGRLESLARQHFGPAVQVPK